DRLPDRAAENALGRCIEEHHLLLLVERDDGIHGGAYDRLQPLLAFLELALHVALLARGLLASGHVARYDRVDPAPGDARVRSRRVDRDLLAVRAQARKHKLGAHAAHCHAGFAEAAHVLAMRVAKA